MKIIIHIFCLLFSFSSIAQNFCADSSTHFRYTTLPSDSIQISKVLTTADSSKIMAGAFKLANGAYGKSFIFKLTKKGDIDWYKVIESPYTNDGYSEIETLAEAANGNIFLAVNQIQSDNKPFSYIIISPQGNIIAQNKFGINNNQINLSNAEVKTSLISKFGADSMLVVLIHEVTPNTHDGMTVLSISNEGIIGQGVTYTPPVISSFFSYYSAVFINGDTIQLFGGSHFYNSCELSFREQPAYSALTINWRTKQIISKRAYCSPFVGLSNIGNNLDDGHDNERTKIFFFNKKIFFTRRIWGLDINGSDTLTRLFSISTFNEDMSHITSEYICTSKRFTDWKQWDYELLIDSSGKKTYTHMIYRIKNFIMVQLMLPGISIHKKNFYYLQMVKITNSRKIRY